MICTLRHTLLGYRLKDNHMDCAQITRGSHWPIYTKVY